MDEVVLQQHLEVGVQPNGGQLGVVRVAGAVHIPADELALLK